ncbi:hypothetical protein TNCV_443321 [Trichonephila clavipes]|nr:hypothetical protein TNCV_443321 [Trichonephila clavipes]
MNQLQIPSSNSRSLQQIDDLPYYLSTIRYSAFLYEFHNFSDDDLKTSIFLGIDSSGYDSNRFKNISFRKESPSLGVATVVSMIRGLQATEETTYKDFLCLDNEHIFGGDQGYTPEIMDEILTTARDLELEVKEDDIEELIMGHENELTTELQEILNEEHQETQ